TDDSEVTKVGVQQMHKKWLIKIGAAIFALTFVAACATNNDQNPTDDDQAPMEQNDDGNRDNMEQNNDDNLDRDDQFDEDNNDFNNDNDRQNDDQTDNDDR